VTTGENEAQPVVVHGTVLLGGVARWLLRHLPEEVAFPRLMAETIERPIAGSRRDPAPRVGRQTINRPLAQSDSERLLDFGYVDVRISAATDRAAFSRNASPIAAASP
jgi:hypothetical protein